MRIKCTRVLGLLFFLMSIAVISCKKKAETNYDEKISGHYSATLTDAPEVPASPGYDGPKKVKVELEVIERVMRLADGVEYNFWTFGGKVPGKFIRIREGDVVEFYLHNHPD